jgi:hypothetical protein
MGLLSDLPSDHPLANLSGRRPSVQRAWPRVLPRVLPRMSPRGLLRGVLCGLPCALLVMALLGASAAGASERKAHEGEYDHDRARAAVKAGEALPLATVLERVLRNHPGQVLDVELERDDGRWLYEFKLLRADGQLVKLLIDARTAQVLSVRANRSDKHQHERQLERPDERPNERPNDRP